MSPMYKRGNYKCPQAPYIILSTKSKKVKLVPPIGTSLALYKILQKQSLTSRKGISLPSRILWFLSFQIVRQIAKGIIFQTQLPGSQYATIAERELGTRNTKSQKIDIGVGYSVSFLGTKFVILVRQYRLSLILILQFFLLTKVHIIYTIHTCFND